MLVSADVVKIARTYERFDDALGSGAGESCEALDVGTTHKRIGLEIVSDEGLDLVERDVGRVGLLSGALETEFLAMADEGLLRSEDYALGGDACSAHLGGIFYGRGSKGERERAKAFEAHAVTVGEVFANDLFDGGDGGMNIGSIEGASCGNSLNDFLKRHGTLGYYSGVVDFRGVRIGVGVGIEFERYSHNYDVLCSAASV